MVQASQSFVSADGSHAWKSVCGSMNIPFANGLCTRPAKKASWSVQDGRHANARSDLEASEALRAVHAGLEKACWVWHSAEPTPLAVLLVFYVPIQCSETALDGTQSAGRLQEQQEVKHSCCLGCPAAPGKVWAKELKLQARGQLKSTHRPVVRLLKICWTAVARTRP